MATVDDRVVAMSFENDKFNAGAEETIGVLGRLKQALNLSGAAQGLDEVDAAGQRIDLSHLGNAAEEVGSKFSILSGAASVALGNIAFKAIEVGGEVLKSFTIEPLVDGFHNYEAQINAVQTIVANTGLSGASGMAQVNSVLKDMQNYANLTVYNFGQMAQAIGTFTAAGVDLKTSQESIKGIANLAALSGSNSQQAASAMYQLSQAIAAGRVQLQDWNSVVNAGIGGKVLQEALFNTGKALGTLKDVPLGETFDEWTKKSGGFRQSLQRGSQAAQGQVSDVQKLAQAHKDAAQTISDAEKSAADNVSSAAQRVKDAQQGVGDAARQSATAVRNAVQGVADAQTASADAARQAAKDIASAMDGIRQAQINLANTNRQASKDIASAVTQEHDTITQSAQNVAAALDSVRAAREKLAEAMKPPSADELQAAQDKLTTAQLDQADLSDAVTKAQQEQARATQDLAFAQQNLAQIQQSDTATPEQIVQAQRAVQDAQQKVKDLTDAQTRALLQQHAAARGLDQAQQDLQATQEKGTKQDKNVQSAQDALTKALNTYHDAQIKAAHDVAAAEQNVRDVRLKSAQQQVQAEQSVTKAEQNLADIRLRAAESERKAQDGIIKAEQNLRDTRISSAESQQKAAQQLSQAEHDQAKATQQAQEQIAKAHEQAAQKILSTEQAIKPKNQQPTWLTGKVLTETLKQFSGDVSEAQLKAEGFSQAQIDHIEKMGKVALQSATQVKTFSQLMQSLKEEVGTAWSQVFKTLFGNIDQAKAFLSPLHQTLENALTGPIYALNKVLQDWSQAGGRTALIDAFKTAWADLGKVLHVVKEAFADIFPPTSGSQLADITKNFDAFIHRLTPSAKTLDEIKRTFQGFFAVLDIGKTIIGDVIHVFADLFGVVGPSAGGGFLALTARLGDFLVKVDDAVKKGTFLKDIMHALGQVLHDPAILFEKLGIVLPPLSKVSDELQRVWDKLTGSMERTATAVHPLVSGFGNLFHSIIDFLTRTFQNINFDNVLHAVDTGLLGGIFLLFKRFFSGAKLTDLVGGGVLKNISGTFGALTGVFENMQQKVKAEILEKIAIAVGLLAGSLLLISTIPPKKLDGALSGLTIVLGELIGAMKLLTGIADASFGAFKLAALAAGMILVAGAVDLLTISVKVLSGLNWSQLLKGLTGVGVLLAEISAAMIPISANSAGMARAGFAIGEIAVALRILASAVAAFGQLSWTELAKGLGAVAATLVSIGAASRLFPDMKGIGPSMIAIALAMKILASAIGEFGGMSWTELAKGMVGVGGALAFIVLTVRSLPVFGLGAQAAGIVLIAGALRIIASAIEAMGELKADVILKGLIGIGGALTILVVGLNAMEGTLPGSAALAVASGAMLLLAEALSVLAGLSVGDIVKGLLTMAGAMGILAIAGIALEPTAPALLAFGAALLAIGGGIALAGAGIALLGVGLGAIAVSGPAAVAIIIHSIIEFLTAVPKFIESAVEALLTVVTSLAHAAPEFVVGIAKILDALVTAVIDITPKMVTLFGALVQGALKAIRDNFPDVVKTGLDMLIALLSGVANHIGKVITTVAQIITAYLGALATHMPKIVEAGANLIAKFLVGVANSIERVVTAAVSVVVHFVDGIAKNLGRIVASGTNLLVKFVGAIVTGEIRMLNAGIGLITQFLTGVAKMLGRVIIGATNIISTFITQVSKASINLIDKGAEAVIYWLNGVAKAIRKYGPQLWNAGWNIISAIIDGMVQGLEHLGKHILDKIGDLFSGLPNVAKKLLGIHSPSTVFMEIGQNIVQGLANGIADNSDLAIASVSDMTDKMTMTVKSFSSSVNDILDFHSPTITPVLDLSEIQKSAALIPGYINPDAALNVSAITGLLGPGQGQVLQDAPTPTDWSGMGLIPTTFVQNNYSPTALSEVDIYRNTKNTISQLTGGAVNAKQG